jgi:hypothetical protein
MNANPIIDVIDFIAPYDDELYILFLGDDLNTELQNKFKKAIKKARKSIPGFIPEVNYANFTTSELFRNKAKEYLDSESCIVIADPEFSQNIIQYITNKLSDEMEGMLIDKFILQAPQEKFIFDVHSVDDDTLNALIIILDERTTAFNYYMSGNYLGIWVLNPDEFNHSFQA